MPPWWPASHTGSSWSFLLTVTVILGASAINFIALREFLATSDNVDQALDLKCLMKDTYATIQRADIEHRGYLARHDDAMLHLGGLLPAITAAQAVETPQTSQLSAMAELIHQQINLMRNNLETAVTSKPLASADLAEANYEERYIRQARQLLQTFEDTENARVAASKERLELYRKSMLLVTLISLAVCFFLLVSMYFLLRKNARKQNSFVQEVQQAKEELDNKVWQRASMMALYTQELERSNRELQDFAFIASHDLQEPLRKIQTFGELLLNHYSNLLDDKGVNYIQRMQRAADRMSLLINDLLTYSRVVSKEKPWETVNLKLIVDRVIDDLEVKLIETKGSVTVSALPEIRCSPWQMQQLFLNLLSNALKFYCQDIPPVIHIAAEQFTPPKSHTSVPWHRIVVKDNGIGFREEYAERIFSPFQRLHHHDEYEGTGIGLALCRRIAERHEGFILAYSKPGQGSEFHLLLPGLPSRNREQQEPPAND
jgi:signal transduction histidine kinase